MSANATRTDAHTPERFELRHLLHDGEIFLDIRVDGGPWVQAGVLFPSARFDLAAIRELISAVNQHSVRVARIALLEWIAANVENIDFAIRYPKGVMGTNPWIAVGSNFEAAVARAKAQMEAALNSPAP